MGEVMDIGSRLVTLRRAMGLTQGDLAATLGVKRQQVQRWESNNYRTASLERVARVADALGWPGVGLPLAAEGAVVYGTPTGAIGSARPVRDLGEIVPRIRAGAAVLSERFGVRGIAVFGSFARGEQSIRSDIDVILELDDPSLEAQFGAERELEQILGRAVETGTLASLNPRVRDHVLAEMVRVWPA